MNPEVAQIIQNNTLNTFLFFFIWHFAHLTFPQTAAKSRLTPLHGVFHGYLLFGSFWDLSEVFVDFGGFRECRVVSSDKTVHVHLRQDLLRQSAVIKAV